MHITGDCLLGGSDFSSSKWLTITDFYLNKIVIDLASDDWTSIFQVSGCSFYGCKIRSFCDFVSGNIHSFYFFLRTYQTNPTLITSSPLSCTTQTSRTNLFQMYSEAC